MKEQYIGDINDYRKYALLRALAKATGLNIGVCWLMTLDDGGSDGNKRQYLNQPDRWRQHDPELFDQLSGLFAMDPKPSIAKVEALPALRHMRYFNNIVPDDLKGREAYMLAVNEALAASDLVFFDPDNGLNVPSTAKGQRNSSKYVYRDEVAAFYVGGKSLLIYQHYPRLPRAVFEDTIAAELEALCPAAVVRVLATGNVVFFLVVHPHHHGIRPPDGPKHLPPGGIAQAIGSGFHRDMLVLR